MEVRGFKLTFWAKKGGKLHVVGADGAQIREISWFCVCPIVEKRREFPKNHEEMKKSRKQPELALNLLSRVRKACLDFGLQI